MLSRANNTLILQDDGFYGRACVDHKSDAVDGVGLVINTTGAATRRSNASVRRVASLVVLQSTNPQQIDVVGFALYIKHRVTITMLMMMMMMITNSVVQLQQLSQPPSLVIDTNRYN